MLSRSEAFRWFKSVFPNSKGVDRCDIIVGARMPRSKNIAHGIQGCTKCFQPPFRRQQIKSQLFQLASDPSEPASREGSDYQCAVPPNS
ncbi:hypothetical protein PM082_008860 [Marasmius tenuissimus]|nr:hypothetical protein PM082_008860 [Marasmius tenuissimus]